MKIAVLQTVSSPRLADNLARARSLLEQAAQAGADLAVLPEYFCLMGMADTDKLAIQERLDEGPIQEMLSRTARELGLVIAGGTLPLANEAPDGSDRPSSRVRNTLLVFSRSGERIARYDKIHLFRFDNGRERYDEARVLDAGAEPVHFDMVTAGGQAWRVGLSICYDLRFPELYRAHAQAGCDLMLVPSAFTHTTGEAHWEVLLRARAIENLAYVAAAAQGGVHENGRRTYGHSLVCDPWGQLLACEPMGEAVVMAELSREALQLRRTQLPALDHRVL